ncbi:MFS transporter [Nocardia sp. ET3-3]|uniref:MFS transporter n=1 Tax=Nocardia terrae TaxID=2675851 RepID=A0A7K1V956_9NOCA|nr:MFS transporter [Nocardia terrae]MVU83174.1 MFS transporter [Nocardia terrae]
MSHVPNDSPSPRLRLILLLVSAATFMAGLDLFIVNVAFPNLRHAFHTDDASLSWVLNAYAIAFAALPIPLGRLADAYGRRAGFAAGLTVFAAASIGCAVAPSLGWLIAARVAQAVGAAALVPTSLSLLLGEFPPARRPSAVATWAASGALAAAAGPPLGGLLVQAGWRWVFLINAPIAALALAGAFWLVAESRAEGRPQLPDLPGAMLLVLGIGLLTLGVVKGNDWSWGAPATVACLVGGPVAVAAFLARCARHRQPVVEPRMFSDRAFSAATAVTVLFFAGFGAIVLGNILFLTDAWHGSVLQAGLEFAPGPAMAALVSFTVSARLIARFGHRPLAVAGTLVTALGSTLLLATMTTDPAYVTHYLPGGLIIGAGVGLTLPTLAAAISAPLPPDQRAVGSGIFAMGRQLGTVLGVAAFIALLGHSEIDQGMSGYDRGWAFITVTELAAAIAGFGILGRSVLVPQHQ